MFKTPPYKSKQIFLLICLINTKAIHEMGLVIFLMCYNLVNRVISKDEKTSGSCSFFT